MLKCNCSKLFGEKLIIKIDLFSCCNVYVRVVIIEVVLMFFLMFCNVNIGIDYLFFVDCVNLVSNG